MPDPRADDDRRPRGGWTQPTTREEFIAIYGFDAGLGMPPASVILAHDRLIEAHGREWVRRQQGGG